MGLEVPQELQNGKLNDLMGEDGGWKWQIMSMWMPITILQKIKALLPPSSEYRKDEFSVTGIGNQGVLVSYLYSRMEKKDDEKEDDLGRVYGILMCMRE